MGTYRAYRVPIVRIVLFEDHLEEIPYFDTSQIHISDRSGANGKG